MDEQTGHPNTAEIAPAKIEAQPANLAENFDSDPRLKEIETELVADWEKANGPRWSDNPTELRGEFQDFQHGDPTAWKRGEEPIALADRAKAEFRKRNPADAAAYDKMEMKRVYDNPSDDPAIRETEKENSRITSVQYEQSIRVHKEKEGGETWERANRNANMHGWRRFVRKYPEKAAAYADKIPYIKSALEGEARRRSAREKQAEVRGPEEKKQPRIDELSEQGFMDRWINSLEDQYALKHIGGRYDKVLETQKRVARFKEDADKNREGMRKIADSMGFGGKNLETQGDRILRDEETRLAEENFALAILERRYLELPPEQDAEDDPRQNKERAKLKAEITEKNGQMEVRERQAEEKLRAGRERFIKQFTKDVTDELIGKLDATFRESRNGDQAKKLLTLKIARTVAKDSEEWIETGKNGDYLEVEAALHCRSYKTPAKGKQQFIASVEIKFSSTPENAGGREKDLLNRREKEELRRAEEAGILKKKKQTA